MSIVPRALRRARLWTAGVMTASTVLVGAIGIHLADAQTQAAATHTSSGASDSSSNSSGSSFGTDDSDDSDDSSIFSSSNNSGSGFGLVAPLNGSNAQPQTNSSGS